MLGISTSTPIQGVLQLIPLSGAASKGGKLMFGATWSLDAGDGIDDKCVFGTDQGELLIFTGTNPADAEQLAAGGTLLSSAADGHERPHAIGGDLLLATVDGIMPISRGNHQGRHAARAGRDHRQHQERCGARRWRRSARGRGR